MPGVLVSFRSFWLSGNPGEPPFALSSADLLAVRRDTWLPELTMSTSSVGIAHLLIRFGDVPGEAAIEFWTGTLGDTVRVDVLPGETTAISLVPKRSTEPVIVGPLRW